MELNRRQEVIPLNRPRIMSKDSNLYHRNGCRYALRIMPKNLVRIGLFTAEVEGIKPCSVCNRMSFIYNNEKAYLIKSTAKWPITFKIMGEELYIKTNVSLWKLVYSVPTSKIILYHRNHSEKEIDFENPRNEAFHRQKDFPPSNEILPVCKYIYEHDRYKESRITGKRLRYTGVNKKYKKKAEKFERKEKEKRIESLFKVLEKENPAIKKHSIN